VLGTDFTWNTIVLLHEQEEFHTFPVILQIKNELLQPELGWPTGILYWTNCAW